MSKNDIGANDLSGNDGRIKNAVRSIKKRHGSSYEGKR